MLLKKGRTLQLTGLQLPDGTPVTLPPALITDRDLDYVAGGGEGTGKLSARVTAVCWVDHLAD